SVMQAWMASPGHRANILNSAFTQIGIGAAVNPNSQWKSYWTQDFGVRAGGDAPGSSASGSPTGSVPPPQPVPQAQSPVLTRLSPAQAPVRGRVARVRGHFGSPAGPVQFSGETRHSQPWRDRR